VAPLQIQVRSETSQFTEESWTIKLDTVAGKLDSASFSNIAGRLRTSALPPAPRMGNGKY
jgi:hypothetical protein